MSTAETEPKKRARRSVNDSNKVKKTTKKKEPKDPNAPKRSITAYIFFANEQRDKVKAENPDSTFAQLNTILGEKWRAMDADAKSPYDKKAAEDKARYEKEKSAYEAKKKA